MSAGRARWLDGSKEADVWRILQFFLEAHRHCLIANAGTALRADTR
jgi:hypothetical protein